MAQKFNVGDRAYIPTSLLPNDDEYPHSLFQTSVVMTQGRSVQVTLRGGDASDWITSSKLHRSVGIAIISIGDFGSEEALLNPLARSVLQFCRLLLDDASVTWIRIRAIGELGKWWSINHAMYSHIIFVGHGAPEGIHFGYGGWRDPGMSERRVFSVPTNKKIFISLCCQTGKAAFSKAFSLFASCGHLIAPFHSAHGAIASQFVQTYMCCICFMGSPPK